MRWPAERDQALLEGLLALAEVVVLASCGPRVPAVVVEFMEDLSESASSGTGTADGPGGSLDDVSEGMTPDAAGAVVGLSGRQVRKLCATGRVRATRVGTRYVVDLVDLRRHVARGAA